jgi:hypothetical protein
MARRVLRYSTSRRSSLSERPLASGLQSPPTAQCIGLWTIVPLPRWRPPAFFRVSLRSTLRSTAELLDPDSPTHPGTKLGGVVSLVAHEYCPPACCSIAGRDDRCSAGRVATTYSCFVPLALVARPWWLDIGMQQWLIAPHLRALRESFAKSGKAPRSRRSS